jgi:hypothetical protein
LSLPARFLTPLLVLAGLLLYAPAAGAANFVVNNSADPTNTNGQCATAGTCSLREAVNASNANGPGLDTITFTVTTATVTNVPIGNNPPNVQGAVTIDGGGTVTIQRTTSLGSSLQFSTGGVAGDLAGTVKNLTLQGSATAGGSNVSVSGGGASQKYALTLDHVTSQGNTVNGSGGGASVAGIGGTLNVVDSTIAGNSAPGGNRGGGIEVGSGAVLNLARSTIANNTASPIGGGVNVENSAGVVTITNTTFSGNNVTAGGSGAAIYEFGAAGLNLSYNTITGSTTGNAALDVTVGLTPSEVKLKGNIFTGNSIPDCTNNGGLAPASQGFNFLTGVGASACNMSALANDHFATPLTLGPLQNNGGPTQTHALPSGSAAINAGGLGGCTTIAAVALGQDQRGVTRPQGSACDSGAFEFPVPANTVAPAITGTPQTGQVLTCSQGTWSGGTPQTFVFDWRRDGVATGATGTTYTVVSADEGHALTCRVTATNSAGSASADSSAVNVTVGGGGGGGGGDGGSGGGGGGGGTGADTTPPAETLSGKAKQDVDKLALTVSSNEAGTAQGQASVGVPGAKKPVTSKQASAAVQANQPAKLTFKFPKKSLRKIKRAIAKGKHPKATITVTAADGAGNTSPPQAKAVKLRD